MTKLFIPYIFCQTLILALVVAQNGEQSDCTLPNGGFGQCIGLRQCQPLLRVLQTTPLTDDVSNFLKQSQCGFDGKDPRVCCPIQNRISNPSGGDASAEENDENKQYDLSDNSLLPTECGIDLSQRIVGGERTELGEFPWLALLIFEHPRGSSYACGGSVINNRYILTAAHCIKGLDIPKSWRLTTVRLGEYDTKSNPDCVKEKDGSQVCADPVLDVGIEETIAHEKYDPFNIYQLYDIALIRMNQNISFTNYIKPICLPSTSYIPKKVTVSGWGKTQNSYKSDIKLKVTIPLVNKTVCAEQYEAAFLYLGYGQVCAGGEKGKDSCTGDSGGPMMGINPTDNGSGRWTVDGVVSFGPSPCGVKDWPGIYTKVYDFIPWILSKLQP